MHRRADGDYKKVASFVAVLPATTRRSSSTSCWTTPTNARTDYSSILAAPVAGNIISEVALSWHRHRRRGPQRTIVTVPNLVGTEWSNAQVQLNIQGLKHQLQESQSSQSAAPVTYPVPPRGEQGALRHHHLPVYRYLRGQPHRGAGCDRQEPGLCPPDAERRRLNCVVEGSGTVQAQSDEPGSSVQRGTIITLTCG